MSWRKTQARNARRKTARDRRLHSGTIWAEVSNAAGSVTSVWISVGQWLRATEEFNCSC
jgi:hypothetical protein